MSDKKNKILSSLFHDGIIDDLKFIMKSSSNNIDKSKMMLKYLKPYGFVKVGRGTNILVVEHKKKQKGYVFKIALDSYGVNDNFVDMKYTNEIVDYVTVYESHRTGMISVHDKVRIIKNDNEARRFYPQMEKMLNRLKKDYLLCDLSLKTFRNFGLVPDKKSKNKWRLVLADGSDIIPLQSGVELTCYNKLMAKQSKSYVKLKTKKCGGKLKYDEEFFELVCQDCGKAYNPTEIYKAKFKEVDVLADKRFSLGLTEKEEQALNKSILKRREKEATNNSQQEANEVEPQDVRKVSTTEEPEEIDDVEIDDDTSELDGDDTSNVSCNFVCDRCDVQKCPFDKKDTDEEDESDDQSEEDDSEEKDESSCCQENGHLDCDVCTDKNVFSYCCCNVCDKKYTCDTAYGEYPSKKIILAKEMDDTLGKGKQKKNSKGLEFEPADVEYDIEDATGLSDTIEKIDLAIQEELDLAEEIKTDIAEGKMLPGDPSEAVFTQATIYDGEDVRRDLEVIIDGPIRVELDEIGNSCKDINILINGEIPKDSNIKISVTQVTENGTETKEVSILEVLEKIKELEQE